MWMLGLKLWSFCLCSKHVINWVISLAPDAHSAVPCELQAAHRVAPVADIV